MEFKTKYNYVEQDGYLVKGKSQTIPDQAMTIKQMLDRTNNGLTVPVGGMEYTNEDEPYPEINDLVDMQEVKQYHKELLEKVIALEQKAKQIKAEKNVNKQTGEIKTEEQTEQADQKS